MLVTIPGVILHLTSESELDLDLVNGDPRVGDPAAAPLTPDWFSWLLMDRFAGPISLEGVPPSLQSHPPFFLQIMSSMCCATSVIATGTFDFRAKILTVSVQRCYMRGDDVFLPLTVSLVDAFINGISMWSVVFSARVAYEIVSDKKGVCEESYEIANQNTLKSDLELTTYIKRLSKSYCM